MIEVFKTNVQHADHAEAIVSAIQSSENGYYVNFDLTDCDKVMRVCSAEKLIASDKLITLLESFGFEAIILPDEVYIR